MQFRLNTHSTLAAAALLALASGAQASVTSFTGSDDGASVSGPWANSAAAESAFGAGASTYGALQTVTFENLAVGYSGSYSIAPGVTVALSAPDYGNGFSGISNSTLGNLYGFNVTAGGSQWLGFPTGSATFSFAGGTNSFGGYFTGLQTIFSGTTQMVITFTDGTSQTLTVPVNVNGGSTYFGFTDSTAFTSLTLTNLSNDAWGLDNVTFNTSAVPEPGSMALMLAGLAVVGGAARRRAAARSAA